VIGPARTAWRASQQVLEVLMVVRGACDWSRLLRDPGGDDPG
jgi:hypothetical protein